MAKKTFGEMFRKIIGKTGLTNTFSDGTEETQNIKEDINDIQKEVLVISKSYLTKAGVLVSGGTVASQNNYDIPTNIDKITNIKVTDGDVNYYPTEISIFDFHTLDNTNSEGNRPTFWTIDKTQLYIFPTPSSSSLPIELNANEYATDLIIDPDDATEIDTNLSIKEGFENVIYYSALTEAFERLEDFASADRQEKKSEKIMKKYVNDVRNPSNSVVVGGGRVRNINPNYDPILTN